MALNSFLTIVILVGAIQGFIVSGILMLSGTGNKAANRFLSVLLFLISFASLGVYLMLSGVKYISNTWLIVSHVVPFFVIMPVGPLIYFYVGRFSTGAVPKNYRWHFTSVLLDVVPQILFICFYAGLSPATLPDLNAFVDQYDTYVDIPRWISATLYLMASRQLLKSNDSRSAEHIAPLKWLRHFIAVFLVFQVIWFLHLVPYIIPSLRNELLESVGWYPVYLPLTALIYYLGIKGILVSKPAATKADPVAPSKLSPERIAFILGQLKNAMSADKLYLTPGLTVASVSHHLDIPAKQISFVINQAESKSFNEFINHYRIEEFKQRIRDPKLAFMTLTGIALECGFNSQATFQRTFKQVTGTSPGEYLSARTSGVRIPA